MEFVILAMLAIVIDLFVMKLSAPKPMASRRPAPETKPLKAIEVKQDTRPAESMAAKKSEISSTTHHTHHRPLTKRQHVVAEAVHARWKADEAEKTAQRIEAKMRRINTRASRTNDAPIPQDLEPEVVFPEDNNNVS